MEKGKFMMIIIIVLLVVLLGTVVGVSFYVLNMVKNNLNATEETSTGRDQITKNLSIEDITYIPLGTAITTNLADSVYGDTTVSHIAKIHVLLGYDNTVDPGSVEFATLLGNNLDYARSLALASIRSYTYEELNADDGPSVLADEIKTRLQNEFNTTLIVGISFDDWFLQ